MEGSLGLAGNVEIIARIQRVISEILSCASVQRIGSALGYDIHHTASVAPVFRLKVGDHVYFCHCIEGQDRGRSSEYTRLVNGWIITESIIHIGSVEQVVVRSAARAVHREFTEGTGRVRNLVGRASHARVQVD